MVTLSKSTGKEGGPDPVLGTNFRKIHASRVLLAVFDYFTN